MAAIGSNTENLALNFMLNAQTATRPVAWGIGLSTGVPTAVAGSEIGTGSGYTRQTAGFGAAAAGTCLNTNAATFGPFSSAMTVQGITVWDTVLQGGSGNLLWFGTLATARTTAIGDSLVIASAALSISLA
jgi:hypothetical protein